MTPLKILKLYSNPNYLTNIKLRVSRSETDLLYNSIIDNRKEYKWLPS